MNIFYFRGLSIPRIVIIALLVPQFTRSAVVQGWVHRYDGPLNGTDVPRAVAIDAANNVIVTGFSMAAPDYSFYTAKYAAANGALLWEKRGPAGEALAVDATGNVIVAGSLWNGTNSDYYTVKYEGATGTLLWERTYNGPQNDTDSARAVAVDGGGNVVVTGTSYRNPTNSNFYTIKYAAPDGTVLWATRFDGLRNAEDSPSAIVVDQFGDVVVTGSSLSGGQQGGYTLKYAGADGALLWERRSPAGFKIAVDRDGNVAVTGSFLNGGDLDIYCAKYAGADGSVLWERGYGTANTVDSARAAAIDVDGNVIVAGSCGMQASYCTVKYAAADGVVVWEQRGPAGSAEAVAIDPNGDVVVTGSSRTTSGNSDYYTAKYAASDGRLLWDKRYNGPDNRDDIVPTSQCLAIGRGGILAVIGYSGSSSRQSPFVYDYATVVYWENPPTLEIAPNGISLRLNGIAGRTYELQRAVSVTGPWSTIATPIMLSNGVLEYVDTNRPAGSAFYRVSTR